MEEKIFCLFFFDSILIQVLEREYFPEQPTEKSCCNRASADFMILSLLMDGEYKLLLPEYDEYRTRKIDCGPHPYQNQSAH
jgi:hypothetical protein